MASGRSVLGLNEADADVADFERENLAKLQTKLRLLEKDMEVQRRQSKLEIQKQKHEMARLEEERDWLMRKLGLGKTGAGDPDAVVTLQDLIHLNNSLDEQLQREANAQLELKNEISNFEQKLLDLKKVGVDPQHRLAKKKKNARAVRLMEDKVQHAMSRWNNQVTRNGELREEIRTATEGATCLLKITRNKKKEIRQIREQVEEVAQQYVALCEANVHSLQKRVEHRQKSGKDRAKYNREMQRLQLLSVRERDLMDFLRTKNSSRELSTGEIQAQEAEESPDTLREVLEKICSVTGENDLKKLLQGFTQAEDENFALYKFVNGQDKEIKALEVEMEQIRLENDKFEKIQEQRKMSHREKMEAISAQLQDVKARTSEDENQARDKTGLLEQIKAGVNSILSDLGCDSDSSSDISSSFEAIENRVKEMLTVKAWLDAQQQQQQPRTFTIL